MVRNKYPRPLCNPFVVTDHCFDALNACEGGNVIECGCYDGTTSMIIADCFRTGFGWKNGYQQYAADTFAGFPYSEKRQKHYAKGDLAPVNARNTIEQLKNHGIIVLRGKVEDTLPKLTKDIMFTFVYIDLDMEMPTRFCCEFFQDRILPGGRIGFHDYCHDKDYVLRVVAQVIDEYFDGGNWREVIREKKGRRDGRFIFFERLSGDKRHNCEKNTRTPKKSIPGGDRPKS